VPPAAVPGRSAGRNRGSNISRSAAASLSPKNAWYLGQKQPAAICIIRHAIVVTGGLSSSGAGPPSRP
jgi:hypothetical protein